jgi:hypothetical protein
VPPSEPRCHQSWTAEDSNAKINLAVSDNVVVSTKPEGGRTCGNGTCPLPLPELAGWLRTHPGALMTITSAEGTVTGMDQLPTA